MNKGLIIGLSCGLITGVIGVISFFYAKSESPLDYKQLRHIAPIEYQLPKDCVKVVSVSATTLTGLENKTEKIFNCENKEGKPIVYIHNGFSEVWLKYNGSQNN